MPLLNRRSGWRAAWLLWEFGCDARPAGRTGSVHGSVILFSTCTRRLLGGHSFYAKLLMKMNLEKANPTMLVFSCVPAGKLTTSRFSFFINFNAEPAP